MGHQSKPSPDKIFIGLLPGTALLAFVYFCHDIFDLSAFDVQMILVGAVLFIAYWKIMEKVFWAPYLKLFEMREGLTSGAEETASEQIAEAARLEEEYENGIQSARIEAMQQKLDAIAESSKEAASVVSAAEDKAKDEILAARKQVQESLEPLRNRLFENAEDMIQEAVSSLKQPAQGASKSAH